MGLIGFLIGREGVESAFPDVKFSDTYQISRTRRNFPDHTPDLEGEDTFELMAVRGCEVVDRVVEELLDGNVDRGKGVWELPL